MDLFRSFCFYFSLDLFSAPSHTVQYGYCTGTGYSTSIYSTVIWIMVSFILLCTILHIDSIKIGCLECLNHS